MGISQEQLAETLGVTYQQVQRYEGGINKLNVENIQLVADALSVPASYFLEIGAPDVVAERPESYLTAEESALLKHFKAIKDKNVKNIIIQIVRLAAERRGGR